MMPNMKMATLFAGISKTNGATASGYVDTKGADFALIGIAAATADVVSNKPSVLKLQEADVTNATSFADISGAVGGTDFTIANADTSNPNNYLFAVDCRKRKRYIQAVYSPQTTQVVAAVAMLGKLEEGARNASTAGALNFVEL